MSGSRVDILKNLIEQGPSDMFPRYGLAMEYVRSGDLAAAAQAFNELLAINADYVAAYFHGGQTLEKLGRVEEARALYRRGIDTATRLGDGHARSELEAALGALG